MPDQIDTTINEGLAEAMGVPNIEYGKQEKRGEGSDTHIYARNRANRRSGPHTSMHISPKPELVARGRTVSPLMFISQRAAIESRWPGASYVHVLAISSRTSREY